MAGEVQRLVKLQIEAAQALAALRAMRKESASAAAGVTGVGQAVVNTNKVMQQSAKAVGDNRNALARFAGSTGQMKAGLQSLAFQVADLGIVLQMGQDAILAFAVQGGQAIGSFGVWGAVIGGLVTVIGLLIYSLRKTEFIKAFIESVKEAIEAVVRWTIDMYNLIGVPIVNWLSGLASSIGNLMGVMNEWGVTLGRVIAYLLAFILVMKGPAVIVAFTRVIIGLAAAFIGLAASIGTVGAALVATGWGVLIVILGEIIYQVYETVTAFDDFGKAWDAAVTLMAASLEGVKNILDGLSDYMHYLVETLRGFMRSVTADILDFLEGMVAGAATGINTIIKGINAVHGTNFGPLDVKPNFGSEAMAAGAVQAENAAAGYKANADVLISGGSQQILDAAKAFDAARKAATGAKNSTWEFGAAVDDAGKKAKGAKTELEKATDALAKFEKKLKEAHTEAKVLDENAKELAKSTALWGTSLDVEKQVAEYTQLAEAAKRSADEIEAGQIRVRAMAVETEKWNAEAKKILDAGTKAAQDLSDSIKNSLVGAFANLGEAIASGKASFSDFARSVLADIAQIILRMQLMNALSALMDENKGLARFLGTVALSGPVGVTAHAKGGIVDRPTLFPFAGGAGLMGEAGPEAIMPLKRGADGSLGVSGGGTVVNIFNQSGAEVETKESRGADGQRQVDIVLKKKISDLISGGELDSPMRNSYGLTRKGRY